MPKDGVTRNGQTSSINLNPAAFHRWRAIRARCDEKQITVFHRRRARRGKALPDTAQVAAVSDPYNGFSSTRRHDPARRVFHRDTCHRNAPRRRERCSSVQISLNSRRENRINLYAIKCRDQRICPRNSRGVQIVARAVSVTQNDQRCLLRHQHRPRHRAACQRCNPQKNRSVVTLPAPSILPRYPSRTRIINNYPARSSNKHVSLLVTPLISRTFFSVRSNSGRLPALIIATKSHAPFVECRSAICGILFSLAITERVIGPFNAINITA